MKRTLLLSICALMIASAAMADHIGIYSDASGTSCDLGNIAGQLSTTATVIHKFATGAVGSRFKATFPPGTLFITLTTTFTTVGVLPTDLSFSYGGCQSDCIVLGTILAIYGAGTLQIEAADGQFGILVADCLFAEKVASGGRAYVNVPNNDCTPVSQSAPSAQCVVAVEQSTWGSVKSLYR